MSKIKVGQTVRLELDDSVEIHEPGRTLLIGVVRQLGVDDIGQPVALVDFPGMPGETVLVEDLSEWTL